MTIYIVAAGAVGSIVFSVLFLLMLIKGNSLKIPFIGMAAFVILMAAGVVLTMLGDKKDGPDTADKASQESGGIGADVGLFNVTVTVPKDFLGDEMTQEQLDEAVKEKGFKSAKLNDDGSATYVMSKSKHRELMKELEQSIEDSLAGLSDPKDNPTNIVGVEHNKDYSEYTVKLNSDTVSITDSIASLTLYFSSGMYHAFNGTTIDNVNVKFVNAATGEVIEEANSKDMGETPSNNSGGEKMTGSGNLGNSYVEIKGAELAELDDGRSAIVVTYAWTNNSDKTTSATASIYEKAFQDGVQIDSISLIGYDGFDFDAEFRDVRPGVTLDIQCAFILTSDTATVEVELEDPFSFSDDVVTMNLDPQNLR